MTDAVIYLTVTVTAAALAAAWPHLGLLVRSASYRWYRRWRWRRLLRQVGEVEAQARRLADAYGRLGAQTEAFVAEINRTLGTERET